MQTENELLAGLLAIENGAGESVKIENTPEKNHEFAQNHHGMMSGSSTGLIIIEPASEAEIAEANKAKVPTQARSMNLRLVLIQNGISIQSVYDKIANLPSPNNELGYQMFEYATHYDRNNQMINTLAQLMNVSQKQLDDFFIQAENLVV